MSSRSQDNIIPPLKRFRSADDSSDPFLIIPDTLLTKVLSHRLLLFLTNLHGQYTSVHVIICHFLHQNAHVSQRFYNVAFQAVSSLLSTRTLTLYSHELNSILSLCCVFKAQLHSVYLKCDEFCPEDLNHPLLLNAPLRGLSISSDCDLFDPTGSKESQMKSCFQLQQLKIYRKSDASLSPLFITNLKAFTSLVELDVSGVMIPPDVAESLASILAGNVALKRSTLVIVVLRNKPFVHYVMD
ncbi:hypothetical protein GEMRC1_009014 [Eukaryota sp. GEM-RC1]